MNIVDQILEGLNCLIGEEGKDFIFYETLERLRERDGVASPYRNPDKTIWSIYDVISVFYFLSIKYIEAFPEIKSGGSVMANEDRHPNDWELLTATSSIALAGRLKILWEYVILGRKPLFTVETWVSPRKEGTANISELKIFVRYPKAVGQNLPKQR